MSRDPGEAQWQQKQIILEAPGQGTLMDEELSSSSNLSDSSFKKCHISPSISLNDEKEK